VYILKQFSRCGPSMCRPRSFSLPVGTLKSPNVFSCNSKL